MTIAELISQLNELSPDQQLMPALVEISGAPYAVNCVNFNRLILHPMSDNVRDLSVDEVELSVRAANCLHRVGIRTLGQLADTPITTLIKSRNLGKMTIMELQAVLAEYELTFPDDK